MPSRQQLWLMIPESFWSFFLFSLLPTLLNILRWNIFQKTYTNFSRIRRVDEHTTFSVFKTKIVLNTCVNDLQLCPTRFSIICNISGNLIVFEYFQRWSYVTVPHIEPLTESTCLRSQSQLTPHYRSSVLSSQQSRHFKGTINKCLMCSVAALSVSVRCMCGWGTRWGTAWEGQVYSHYIPQCLG